ncbi:NAD(P)-dependent alcohol dehydrogenase [Halovibrio salipaludis]|uniref:NAD(P)-dependent alcohol dehydrogenase n=1 Tax=Halovibrio salipaludis TaxID=2032626 RepID=A0A2A2F830_9GAMM|nr:NAD(P)-dependent alcohol dehydrogenase [Halovibrio salipaludis]PAU80772.1 NAD(P)-dependent alcohol dehydrogenase [Halovibrio salipaludis]
MKTVTVTSPGGLDNLRVTDQAEPGNPGPGEIRVRLHANSLNFHDFLVANGGIPTEDGRIPMSDGAGVVEAVGEGVEEFAVGDNVVSTFFPPWLDGAPQEGNFTNVPGDGLDGYAREQVVRAATSFTHAPEGHSHAEAATLTTAGLTAWRALTVDNHIKAGDTILILGTGGVSIFALQFARSMGVNVIATSSSNEKLERLKQMGAQHTINYKEDPKWGKTVKKLTNGQGVDQVIEVGGPGTVAQSIEAIRVGGLISLIGVLTGSGGEVPTAKLMAKQARLQGLLVGSRRHQIEMVQAINSTGLKPVIDRSFKLDEIADAFRHEEAGKHFGKICLEF